VVVACLAGLVPAAPAFAEPDVYGLTTGDALVRFNVSDPLTVTPVAPLTGLEPGEHAVAMAWPYDFASPRALPGFLYVITNQSRLYRVDPATGKLWSQGPPLEPGVKGSWFGMTNTRWGYDYVSTFSDSGQVMDIAPARGFPPEGSSPFSTPAPAGVGYDHAKEYAEGDVAEGQTPSFASAAFHYVHGPGGIADDQIFAIDAVRGTLVRADDPQGNFSTVGSLGAPVGKRSGLALLGDGPAVLATAPDGTNASRIYTVDVATGGATQVGTLPDGVVVRSLAYVPPPSIQIHGWNLGLIDYGIPAHTGAVERTGDPAPAVSVDWTLECGQWGCPADGTPARPQGGTIEFAPGQLLATYTIATQRVEWGSFEAIFQMSNPSGGAVLGQFHWVTYEFFDDQPKLDPPPAAVHSSDAVADVTVERTLHAAARSARVTYAVEGGSAVPGRDYVPVHGSLTLAKGQTTKTFKLHLAAGRSDGGRRTVGLQLKSAGGLAKDHAMLTLVSDRKLGVKLERGRVEDGRLPVALRCTATCDGRVTLRDVDGGKLDRHSVHAKRGEPLRLRLDVSGGRPGRVDVDVHDGLGRRAHRSLSLR
jgi:hypothetical protein